MQGWPLGSKGWVSNTPEPPVVIGPSVLPEITSLLGLFLSYPALLPPSQFFQEELPPSKSHSRLIQIPVWVSAFREPSLR